MLSRIALGAIAALLTPAAPAAQLPELAHPQGVSPAAPFADFASGAPSGTGQRVVIADGAQLDYFGWSVAIDGDTALVGAYGVTVNGYTEQGAAYVFTKTDGVWILAATLTGSDGFAFDLFGERVALSGNIAAIGAYGADGSKGAVYVFSGSGSHWTEKARLVADDGAANDCLGWSLAATGQMVLAGAPFVMTGNVQTGAVYAFAPSGGTWVQTQKFFPDDVNSGDGFGSTVAADGTTAIAAADGALVGANYGQGAAYVYSLDGGTWTQQAKLTADDGAAFDNFGRSVAVSGSTVFVGAPYAVIDGNGFEGAAYVFNGSGANWRQDQKLVASDGAADGYFGWSVAVSGDNALVGAGSYNMARAGEAYSFARQSGLFEETHVYAGDGGGVDDYGWSVGLSGSDAIVGEPFAYVDPNYAQGATFFYTLEAPSNDTIFANGFE
ncbi:MAG TPA: FG-GAP repeat protein [Rhodanobacteraceae bacterium]|nr:FG-GAP repeat protein [Rhodanobacteraceae bacterium]